MSDFDDANDDSFLDNSVDEFEKAWRKAPPPPSIDAHLPATEPPRTRVLLHLVSIDLEKRLKDGESIRVEAYLERYPEIGQPDRLLELLAREYEFRRRTEPELSAGSYVHRFSQLPEAAILERLAQLTEDGNLPKPISTLGAGKGMSSALPPLPKRYQIDRELGRGSFGAVFLAVDELLSRTVAIKVPHRALASQHIARILDEARLVVKLDFHPSIVQVYDVGATEDGRYFIISQYIDGSSLAERLKKGRLLLSEAAELMATIADALHYVHSHKVVHRDVKPANILLDVKNRAYLADFGLAVLDVDLSTRTSWVGTPAYMSPEQARGESHLVDGRSDVFSAGAVFYELLCGLPPFRGGTVEEVLRQIRRADPWPPRQLDDRIDRELERICLKALRRKKEERYSPASEMANDLRSFLSRGQIPAPPLKDVPGTLAATLSARPAKIAFRGLMPFGPDDREFFLDMLPGPRDRDQLPESLRVWKDRVEDGRADDTFRVGVIYGPSGCGKSSFVRAGLLPCLSRKVLPVYVEATPDNTESTLLRALRNKCGLQNTTASLQATLAAIRRGQGLCEAHHVLIVLDQFEQWLHGRQVEQDSELVLALRQCVGGRVQCIVLVRDDFWMPVTRFFEQLEVSMLKGHNSEAIDLFDPAHARKVLRAFGEYLGKLSPDTLTAEQTQFLERVVAGLAEQGKIICVRLAIFAEMMKSRDWNLKSLRELGGTDRVALTFIEESFGVGSPPTHRTYEKAARAVLKSLLPESGSTIKGRMLSEQALKATAGYEKDHVDWQQLMTILDTELRLITPAAPDQAAQDELDDVRPHREKHYQLAHDYLIPPLREWLTRKQKETRQGLAELLLEERAALWNAKPENRHLPSWWEYLNIRWHTQRNKWTATERTMMRKARRVHGVRTALGIMLITAAATIACIVQSRLNEQRSAYLVKDLLSTSYDASPGEIVRKLKTLPTSAAQLEEQLDGARAMLSSEQQARLTLALFACGARDVRTVLPYYYDASPNLAGAIIAEIASSDTNSEVTQFALSQLPHPSSGQSQSAPDFKVIPTATLTRLRTKLHMANGLLVETSAFCATLTREDFSGVNAELSLANYHLSCLRPFVHGRQRYVAAIWRKNGKKSAYCIGDPEAIDKRNHELLERNYEPADVCGFEDLNTDGVIIPQFAVVWNVRQQRETPCRLVLNKTTRGDFEKEQTRSATEGFLPIRYSVVHDNTDVTRYSAVFSKEYADGELSVGSELVIPQDPQLSGGEIREGLRAVSARVG